ncbi:MAG: TonB-dependent receptor [Pseudomonadota bacterium]
MRRERTGASLKKMLISSAALATAAGALTLTAVAQDGDDEEAAVQDTIVVTGSRIPTDPNLTSSTPVQSLSDDDFRLSGELNLADVVNDIPALVSSLTAENSATGANSLNLRGLGDERTLTLVNGRRHVAGFRGTQAVDVGTIPRALVESVEVTTGGASAIYGADAVTGVVNFVLKDDFEGFQIDATAGISDKRDAETFSADVLWGSNFHNDRGNVVLALTVEQDSSITYGDRSWSRNNGIAVTQANPDLRLQPGDLGPDTPNFNTLFGTPGSLILSGDFTGLTLTAAEQALVDRASNSSSRTVVQDPRFWLTSQEGSIAPSFFGRNTTYVDINNNGVADCQESQAGRAAFLAGCWLVRDDGSVGVFQDGLIVSGGLWGAGGDGGRLNFDRDYLFPETDKFVINLNSNYDLSDTMSLFFEGKYVNAQSETFGEQDTFYDTLFIPADNPFIPAELQPVVDTTGYLLLTQDPLDFSDNNPSKFTRETYRFVGGLNWEFAPGHSAEFSVNHGVFKNKTEDTGLYLDRIFAAIDAVEGPDGNIVCRSDLDPTAAYNIDYFTAGNGFADGGFSSDRYYSFTPGDGQCQPLNPFGTYSASAAAQNFVTSQLEDNLELEQTVISAIATGQFDILDVLFDGPIGYAAGVEYREETSDNQLDSLTLGILPQGTSFTPGVQVSTIDPFLFSFTSIDNDQQFNTSGSYDVTDLFTEIRVPIFLDRPFAKELTFDAAIRLADYSTVGDATTWKVGGTWAPIEDLSFRATFSEAVRAPNISELFDPKLPITIAATADPCDPGNVDNGAAVREANCISALQTAGVPAADVVDGGGNLIWNNPLTGRFSGVSGGNPDLDVETAETLTVGAVVTPSFVDNLSFTVDYWEIEIEDAIAAVAAGDILDGCFDSADFPNVPFCGAFTRRADGGLNFLDSGTINFAKLEAKGFDFSANYSFDVGENTFGARLVASNQDTLDRFFNPLDLSVADPEVGEVQIPEWSGNLTLTWDRGPLSVALQTNYQDKQSVDEIEDIDLYDNPFFDETYVFDINASYEWNDSTSFYGGINNIADEEPFAIETAWPVGPRGRFFFVGVTYRQ